LTFAQGESQKKQGKKMSHEKRKNRIGIAKNGIISFQSKLDQGAIICGK